MQGNLVNCKDQNNYKNQNKNTESVKHCYDGDDDGNHHDGDDHDDDYDGNHNQNTQ